MIEISYWCLFGIITAAWVVVRSIIAYRGKTTWKREVKMLLVYICLVVIARFVYFPMAHDANGRIVPLVFDPKKIFPLWVNLVPIVHLFDIYDGWIMNIVGNICMFIPVGIVWPICFKKLNTVGKTILSGACFTLLIELSQLPLYDRCSDIDDLILNTVGVAIGAVITFFWQNHLKSAQKIS